MRIRIAATHVARIVVVFIVVSMMACVDSAGQVSIGDDCDSSFCGADGSTPSFTPPPDDGGDASSDKANPQELLCIATECPSPYATCGAELKCTTNLSNDLRNCGTCGHKCPAFLVLGVKPGCFAGKCRYECRDQHHSDCNGLVEDGCEVNHMTDPGNCGSCGHACPDGVRCIEGSCGCPSGLSDCKGYCTDLKRDNRNCETCGSACPSWTEAGWPEPPRNMLYSCRDAECQKLECVQWFRDCDGLSANGCETSIANDPANCGACGRQCAEGQRCEVPWSGATSPTCMCASGLTFCNGSQGPSCADLLSDVNNCGACDNRCMYLADSIPNIVGECSQGRCSRKCVEGFADCDGDPSNGCEVNLMVDGSNCGGCGHWCDAAQGQPCIKGACLMTACDAGVGAR